MIRSSLSIIAYAGPSEQAEDNQKDEQKINPKKSLYEHLLQVKEKHNIAQKDTNSPRRRQGQSEWSIISVRCSHWLKTVQNCMM